MEQAAIESGGNNQRIRISKEISLKFQASKNNFFVIILVSFNERVNARRRAYEYGR